MGPKRQGRAVPRAPKPPKKKSFFRQGLEGLAYFAGNQVGLPKTAKKLMASGLDYLGVGSYMFRDGTVQGTPPPVRLRKIEYIRDILGSVAFSNTSQNIDPTDPLMFKWLSQIAPSFQRYRFNSLVFHWKSTSGASVASSNTALGNIGLVCNYDPDAPAFTTKVQAETTGKCFTCVPSQKEGFYGVECKKSLRTYPWLFVNVAQNQSKENKLLFPGKLNQFTQGQQVDDSTLGELWVEYDITLIDPIEINPGSLPVSDIYLLQGTGTSTQFGLGSLLAGNLGTNFASSIVDLTNLAPGDYLLYVTATLQESSTFDITFTATRDLIASSNSFGTSGQVSTPGPNAGVFKARIFTFTKPAPAASNVALSFSGGIATVGAYIIVVPLFVTPDNLSTFDRLKNQLIRDFNAKDPELQKQLAMFDHFRKHAITQVSSSRIDSDSEDLLEDRYG
jgi:hypothetical protein